MSLSIDTSSEPVLVTEYSNIVGNIQFQTLVTRIASRFRKANFYPQQDKIAASFWRLGPFTFCRTTYHAPKAKFQDYTGFGVATKSHTDHEHKEAGINISFSRAVKDMFGKYVALNKKRSRF